jgi:hypothetical protein|tara:strand:- start:2200 stop:3555 length:1356 start_codon:yes stop_codon:yes gene_type:complete
MLLIGVDKFTDWGPPRETKHGRFTPIDNCFEYKSFGYNPCDSGFVIGEYFEDEDVDIKLVSDIKDENYIYPVCVRNLAHSLGIHIWEKKDNNTTFLDFIPEKTLNHFRINQAKLLIYYGYEEDSIHGDSLFRLYNDLLKKLLEKNIPIKNVIYSDANILLNEESNIDNIKLVVSNYCTNTVDRYNNEHKNNLYHGPHTKSIKNRKKWEDSRNRIRDKYFLCYNRLPKSHRALTVLSLDIHNNLDKGIVSFPDYGMSSWDVVEEEKDYLKSDHYSYLINDKDIESKYEKGANSLKKKLPLVLDKKDFTICHSVINNIISHYLNTYFTICTESHFESREKNGNAIGLTEKTWKPILNFHPFILVANAGSLKQLKEYGFKTFEPFINESYDDIDNTGERFLAIEEQINKLCNKPIEEIHEWYWSIEDILKHNYYHFYQKFSRDERARFINEINC